MHVHKFLLSMALPLAVAGCAQDEANDIFKRLVDAQEEVEESRLPVVLDPEYEVGLSLTGTMETETVTRHYRWTEDDGVEEQVAYQVNTPGNRIETRTVTTSGQWMETFIGRGEIHGMIPDTINDTVVQTIGYWSEIWSTPDEQVTVMETDFLDSNDNDSTERTEDDLIASHGLAKYFIEENSSFQGPVTLHVVVECLDGDAGVLISPGVCIGTTFFGLKTVGIGQMWDNGNAVYHATTKETLDVEIDGAPSTITPTRVDILRLGEQDPADEIVDECVEGSFFEDDNGDTTTLDDGEFDCPQVIVRGQEWWWNGLLVRSERTTITVSLDNAFVSLSSGNDPDSGTDPGLGFELFESCDTDGDTNLDGDCRFISDNDSDAFPTGDPEATAPDFGENRSQLSRYAHYQVVTQTQSWQVESLDRVDVMADFLAGGE